MINTLFFIVLRAFAIPVAAIYLLSSTSLGEEGALIAVGLALLFVNLVSIGLNLVKILGNTILLKPGAIGRIMISIGIQIISLVLIWGYYLSEHTDLLDF
ncbi:MAG: hypothetical protein Q9M91_07465 [Candidatus Dojkabacteria bacterium]|nr:hypothetical protein [Candidatus Dojkabacteria bacterium]MDQ7021624.1 hypothetical protein [Candidatus Dojkabacteria bacterium]